MMPDPDQVLIEDEKTPSSPKELENALYASCASHTAGKDFNQQDLMALNIIPGNDLKDLARCLDALVKDRLLKLMQKDGLPCWRVVKREDAAKYKDFTLEEAMVYSYIESSQREGIWIKNIYTRANLHQGIVTRCVKSLESRGRIKTIQNAKFPKRKTYMLAGLQPSEDVTGGAFYTDGNLDEDFVDHLLTWIERYIIGRSWWHPPAKESGKKRDLKKLSTEEAEELRRGTLDALEARSVCRERNEHMLPMPPGFIGYPTISEITRAVNASKMSLVVMKEAEMRQLVDILCWDGRITKACDGKRYKAVRRVGGRTGDSSQNGLVEAPCGRCPVFGICEEGGPVNPKDCRYFQEWLEI